MKRVPEKFTEEIHVDLVDVFLYPLGTKAGLMNTDTIELVLTNVSDIFPDMVEKYREMERNKNLALMERGKIQKKNVELHEELDKKTDRIEKLLDKIQGGAR